MRFLGVHSLNGKKRILIQKARNFTEFIALFGLKDALFIFLKAHPYTESAKVRFLALRMRFLLCKKRILKAKKRTMRFVYKDALFGVNSAVAVDRWGLKMHS